MWESIGESSAVIIGAAVLFLLFAGVLFFMERDELKKRRRKNARPYLVPKPSGTQSSSRQQHTGIDGNACHDMKMRKIS